MRIQGRVTGILTGIATVTVASSALTGCGSSDAKISVDKVQQAADKAIAAPGNPCPLGLDVDAALKKAGLAGTATPGADPGSDTPAVDAESATSAQDDSPLKQRGGAMITCAFTLSGGGSLQATLTGVHTGTALTLMAPLLQRDGELARSDLTAFVTRKLETGKAVVTPNAGLASVAKLDGSGGDVLLEVRTVAAGHADQNGPIVGEPLRALTEALGKQVRV